MTQSAIIILAGGKGERFGSSTPKQLTMLAGKPILEHLLINMSGCDEIGQIVVVSRESILDEISAIAERVAPGKIKVVAGGENRLASTRAGLEAVDGPRETKVLVHDGVRPFLKHRIIRNCLAALDKYEAIDVVIPSSDTLVQVDPDQSDFIGKIPPRAEFRRGQTPQGFWLGSFRDVVYGIKDLESANFTDDCGMYLASKPNAKVGLVDGDETNIKITHPMDLFIAEQLIVRGQATEEHKTQGVDLKGINVVIFGASSGLGADATACFSEVGINVFAASRQTGIDVTKPDQIADFLSKVAADVDQIDVVINCTGKLHIGEFIETSHREIESVVKTNYQGSLNVARESYAHLSKSEGQLILFASSSYSRGRAEYAVYSSSKAAVVNLTQALADEWAAQNVRVNCVVPRRADTPMRWAAFPDEDRTTLLQPAEVSSALLMLLESSNTGLITHVY